MKIPENFNKIDTTQFKIDNDNFTVETDYANPGDCWVIHDGMYDGGKYPLCFDIDWEKEKFTIIKCQPGNGRAGDTITAGAPLHRHLVKDADTFINSFLKPIVSKIINKAVI